MIPKRIFFYWENNKMSWMRYMTLYSFRKFNPDWEMDLYYENNNIISDNQWDTNNSQDFSSYVGEDYFDKIKDLNINIKKIDFDKDNLSVFKNVTPSGKSDIFKWYELSKNGGVYSDMDILYIRPMDELYSHLIENNVDTLICQDNYKNVKYLSVGFIASAENNDFYKDIFNNCFKFNKQDKYETYGVDCLYDSYDMSFSNNDVLNASKIKYPELNIYNLSFKMIYPFNSDRIEYCYNNVDIKEVPSYTIGYHWYAGHPLSQKYNNLLNENNYQNYNNLFCNLSKKILNE